MTEAKRRAGVVGKKDDAMPRARAKTARAASDRTLRIGIASVSEMRARTLAIARGELKPKSDDPKVWMPSAETFGKILSGKNKELLDRIRSERPSSLQALSEITGRKVPSLSRTLKSMERYGLVMLERGAHGRIRPVVPYDELDLKIQFGTGAKGLA
jgi:predicted transcriptional regulator